MPSSRITPRSTPAPRLRALRPHRAAPGARARVALLAVIAAAHGAPLLAGGCRSAREEAKAFAPCGSGRPCRKPNLCLRESSGGNDGICVHPCAKDGDCPAPFLCSGRYVLRSRPGQFCRMPAVEEGGDCSQIRQGCKGELRCFRNRCHRLCKEDKDCPDPARRCLQVVDSPTPGAPATAQYKACVAAPRVQGERCDPAGPFCARGHVCHNNQCLKACTGDAECGAGQICDGSLYTGPKAKARADANEKPDLLYCRQAGGLNAFCNLRLDKSCARSLYCLGSRCRRIQHAPLGGQCRELRGLFCGKDAVCYAGRCRKTCQTPKDCPARKGEKPRCEERMLHGAKQKLCL